MVSNSGIGNVSLDNVVLTAANTNNNTYTFAISVPCSNGNVCAEGVVSNLGNMTNSIAGLTLSSAVFTINGDGANCSDPCVSCTVAGGNICTSCAEGMIVHSDTCLPAQCPFLYCSSCLSPS